VKRLFTGRRLLASLVGSFLLHATLFVGWPAHVAPPAGGREPIDVSLEAARAPEPARALVAMAGERPSGRGQALAGSHPSKAGRPRQAARTETAAGRAVGPGSKGVSAHAPSPPAAAPLAQPLAQVAPAPGPADLVPLPLAAADEVAQQPDPAPLREVAPTVDAEDAFDRLAREQRMRLERGNGGGLAGFGDGNGGTAIGLGTELSGRHVADSHVAAPPVVVRSRAVECALTDSLRLSATVRVLVTRTGEAAVPRLALSSGESGFDACALRYVVAMSFSPGVDAGGHPLDVWMNVRVRPLVGGQVGVAP
jgi:hypothetical protein